MEAALETNVEAVKEFAALNKLQKLAGLLLMLTPENAALIMRHLDEHELEGVSTEMAKLAAIGQGLQKELLREFSPVAVEAASAISGGVDRTQQLLEKSVGLSRASDIICRVSPTRPTVAAMERIVEMDARQIYNLLRNEQLQTITLVVSYLPRDKASQLLCMVRSEVREQVIERLANLAPTSVEVVESVAEALQRKFGANRSRARNQTGGVKVAAQVLNALPKDISKSILATLGERNSELADAVRKKMFTFEELEMLDAKSLQRILQVVDTTTLTVSLKTASDKLKNALLSCMSKRGAENVRETISFMGPLKVSEVEAARSQIIDVVRQLESEGEIDLEAIRQAPRF